jgi:hypothetical protein
VINVHGACARCMFCVLAGFERCCVLAFVCVSVCVGVLDRVYVLARVFGVRVC